MTLTVHVLQHHIDAGVRGNCRLCPVAMALQQATGGEAMLVGFRGVIWAVWPRGHSKGQTRIPAEVAAFIRRFDRGEECGLFSFTVEVPG